MKSEPTNIDVISLQASSYGNHRFDPYYEEQSVRVDE